MELNEYQKQAMTTCMESSNNFAYMMLNLVGEVGEFASKVAKAVRKDLLSIGYSRKSQRNQLVETHLNVIDANGEELKKEAGDILWQLAGLCSVMGWSLEEVAQQNLDKLSSRKQRNVIDGNGDNR